MDKTTHEVRLSNWRTIINNCQARPQGQTAKQWLTENGISTKQYYYWLRRVRQEAYHAETAGKKLPAVAAPADVILTEITGFSEELSTPCVTGTDFTPDAVLRVMNTTIEFSNSASAVLISRIVKAVAHAV